MEQAGPSVVDRLPRGLAPLAVLAVGFGGLVAAATVLAPLAPVPPLAAYLVAFATVAASAVAAGLVAPCLGAGGLAITVLACGAALGALSWAEPGASSAAAAAAVTVALLVGGATLGGAVGGRVEHPGHLLVVAVLSLLVDSFSVFHEMGPTAAVAARPSVLALVALPWPMLGTGEVAPLLGVGDVVFAALYLRAARRHGLGRLRTAAALGVGLALAAAAVVALAVPVPALPFMGVTLLVVIPRARRLRPEERRTVWLVVGCLALLWALVFAVR